MGALHKIIDHIGSMSPKTNRTITKRLDGNWKNKKNTSERASTVHKTQREAESAARRMLSNQGGGELAIRAVNGRIRSKDTIPPGNDPNPRKTESPDKRCTHDNGEVYSS
jgi:hypothetical protein